MKLAQFLFFALEFACRLNFIDFLSFALKFCVFFFSLRVVVAIVIVDAQRS